MNGKTYTGLSFDTVMKWHLDSTGFPTGVKWSFVPRDTGKPTFLVVNFDESEPGTFNNRELIERDPHQFLEGAMIAAYAIGCRTAFIYCRGEYLHPGSILERAIAEAYAKGFLGKGILGSDFQLDVVLHRGAGAYICGEETGLMESLEGRKGQPRKRPPFPATAGLGRTWLASAKPPEGGASSRPNIASAYVQLRRRSDGTDLGTFLVSQFLNDQAQLFMGAAADETDTVDVDGTPYRLQLRYRRQYKPYAVTLTDVRRINYGASETPRRSRQVTDSAPARSSTRASRSSWGTPTEPRAPRPRPAACSPETTSDETTM